VLLTSGGKSSETPTTTTTGTSKVETIAKVILALRNLQYSRKDETQADLYGVDFMTRAGWQPLGMVHLMQMFVAEEAASGGGTIEFLRTHPNPKNRIADIRNKMNKDYPAAAGDPRLAVARDAYQKNVITRLATQAAQPKK
jgi:predicted Zn-dependent protease